MDEFMEGNECSVSYAEMNEAWHRFWNKNQLAINKRGTVYRTTIPRRMPSKGKFDLVNYGRRKKTIYT